MTLKNISNKKDNRKVELVCTRDGKLVFANWYKNWASFMRTTTYKRMLDKELEYCIVKHFNNWYYISVGIIL